VESNLPITVGDETGDLPIMDYVVRELSKGLDLVTIALDLNVAYGELRSFCERAENAGRFAEGLELRRGHGEEVLHGAVRRALSYTIADFMGPGGFLPRDKWPEGAELSVKKVEIKFGEIVKIELYDHQKMLDFLGKKSGVEGLSRAATSSASDGLDFKDLVEELGG